MRSPLRLVVFCLSVSAMGEPMVQPTTPEYCNSDSYANDAACFASNPPY
jgi:hypothetical protein